MPVSAPPPSRRRTFAVLPLAWAALVLWLTLSPTAHLPRTPHWELLSFDTAAHAFVFVVLAGLLIFSVRRQAVWPAGRRWAWPLVLVFCLIFGASIEVMQTSMALGRHGEWSDVISDSLGTVAGLGGMWLLKRQWQ
ncbi:VanZ family protein [Hymenobacter weizhouensis]|uniref:VanZ family protein n=1 Tax=Hymenobacter sp. YIM 151500-1 TaxID=2987689 RepID=UPI002225C110|nr:VanZ family protein [Hymenobacter sp. YIM 151500-1]UYZ62734.1 VanZ family protein [Hymenobacter sp. YIM 151500-1]